MTRIALFFFVVMTAAVIASAFLIGGQFIPALAAFLLGALWIFSLVRRWKWAPSVSLFGGCVLTVAGFILDLSPFLLTAACFSALLAWDLVDFTYRLDLAAPDDDTSSIERDHWLWLAVVIFAGVAVVVAAQTLRVKFTFEWLAGLLIFAVWGVGRVMGKLLSGK